MTKKGMIRRDKLLMALSAIMSIVASILFVHWWNLQGYKGYYADVTGTSGEISIFDVLEFLLIIALIVGSIWSFFSMKIGNLVYKKRYLLCVLIGIIIVTLINFFTSGEPLNLRIVDTLKQYTSESQMLSVFKPEKLVDLHDETALNGDEEISGTFRLNSIDIQKLFNIESPLVCNPSSDCIISKKVLSVSSYCIDGKRAKQDVAFKYCIDSNSNEVYWSYNLY